MGLNYLKPALGSIKAKKRKGRGQGSGKGGTSTRGHKGAQSRSGYKKKDGMQGGQTPLQRCLPKYPRFAISRGKPKVAYKPLNIGLIAKLVLQFNTKVITPAFLQDHGQINKGEKYKILAKGDITEAIDVTAHAFSAKAAEAIKAQKGSIKKVV